MNNAPISPLTSPAHSPSWWSWGLFGLVLLSALTPIRDTDAWTHLALGNLMIDLGSMPIDEPYVYTAEPGSFFFSSWLFSALSSVLFNSFGYSALVIFKALIVASAFMIMARSLKPEGIQVLAVIVVVWAVAMLIRERYVLRPDIVMFLFLSLVFWVGQRLTKGQTGPLVWLPLIHLAWANLHSSVILVVHNYAALYLIIGYGLWVSRSFDAKWAGRAFIYLSLAALASGLAITINPNGLDQLTYGSSVLDSAALRDSIAELRPTNWSDHSVEIITVLIACSLVATTWLRALWQRQWPSTEHWFATVYMAPFIAAFLFSNRFFYPLVLVAIPAVIHALQPFLQRKDSTIRPLSPWIWAAVGPVLIGATVWLMLKDPADQGRFGIGAKLEHVPEDALTFLDQQQLDGRLFNPFNWGGYIAWRDHPRRSMSIDTRGNVSSDVFKAHVEMPPDLRGLTPLSDRWGFDIALIAITGFRQDAAVLNHPNWALVYWDDHSMVYLRRTAQYQALIAKQEYHYLSPHLPLMGFRRLIYNNPAAANILAELKRALSSESAVRATTFAAMTQFNRGDYQAAIRLLQPHGDDPRRNYRATVQHWLGYSHSKTNNLELALKAYTASLAAKEDPATHHNMALVLQQTGRNDEAIEHLEQAVALAPRALGSWNLLAQIYRGQGDSAQADKIKNKIKQLRAEPQR
ncbi:MAG: tetratricopeptide repeat protein [Motiliproteus sp.]